MNKITLHFHYLSTLQSDRSFRFVSHRFSAYLNFIHIVAAPRPRKRCTILVLLREEGRRIAGEQGWKSRYFPRRGGNTSDAVPERLISKWRHLSVEADTYVLPSFHPTVGWCARRGWSGCLLVSSTRKDRRLLREQRKKCTFLLSAAREKRAEKYSPRIIVRRTMINFSISWNQRKNSIFSSS